MRGNQGEDRDQCAASRIKERGSVKGNRRKGVKDWLMTGGNKSGAPSSAGFEEGKDDDIGKSRHQLCHS